MLYGSMIPSISVNPSLPVMTNKSNATFNANAIEMSNLERSWVNSIYLPFIARPDTWADLAPNVYKSNNSIMNSSERETLIRSLNNGSLPPPIPSYQVSFNLNGATVPPPSNQSVIWNTYASTPPTPTWPGSGCTFVGWYDNPALSGSAVNFATYKITSAKTFYAKWNCPTPPTANVKIVNNTGYQRNGNIQIQGSGFLRGISMGSYSTSPSSGWSTVTLTPGTYYLANAVITDPNYNYPIYCNVKLEFGTSTSPPQIASWTQAWDGSSQDRSISLNIASGNTYYVIVTLY